MGGFGSLQDWREDEARIDLLEAQEEESRARAAAFNRMAARGRQMDRPSSHQEYSERARQRRASREDSPDPRQQQFSSPYGQKSGRRGSHHLGVPTGGKGHSRRHSWNGRF